MLLSLRAQNDGLKVQSKPRKRDALDAQLDANIANLQTVAQHLVESTFEAQTAYYADHTFSGIMFPVECINNLPIQFVEIQSIAVRGELGPMSVYTCSYDPASRKQLHYIPPSCWERRFGPVDCSRSPRSFTELEFSVPLRLAPSQFAGIYVHSELPGDLALVYADQRTSDVTYKDQILSIHPGIAHTSSVPFSNVNMWGGSSWRSRREFVGSVKYGTRFLLWTPLVHDRFPANFRRAICTFLCSHHVLGKKSYKLKTLGDVPLDVFFNIVNFMPHDWFNGEEDDQEDSEDDEEISETDEDRLMDGFPFGFGIMDVGDDHDDDDDEDDDEDDQE